MKKLIFAFLTAALIGCAKESAKCTITFETNGGTEVASITVDAGAVAQAPDTPSKDNSCFLGWYRDSACTDTFNFAMPITSNLTLYAAWSKRHTITFVLNGGIGQTFCHVCDSLELPELSEPTRGGGYSFVDWCADSLFSYPFLQEPLQRVDIDKPPYYTYRLVRVKVTKDTTLYPTGLML